MQIMTLLIILCCIIGFEFLLLIGYLMLTAPVAFPYLRAKTKKGILLILKTDAGRYVLTSTDKHYKTKHYGQFLPNTEAVFQVAGVPASFAYTGMAVPPSEAACEAAEKLQEANAEVFLDLSTTAAEAEIKGILKKRDVQALFNYANNVSPTFVESRIEHRVSEILASNRDNLGKLMGYAIVFIMIMIGGGVAMYMASQGTGTAAVDAAANAVTMNV